MKQVFQVFCVCWLAVAIVGCGSGTAEIKAKRDDGSSTLNDAEKKARDEAMKKSMERSGYGNRGVPAKQP